MIFPVHTAFFVLGEDIVFSPLIVILKVWISEKATKFEEIFVVLLTRASLRRVLCAQQRTCQKVDEDF